MNQNENDNKRWTVLDTTYLYRYPWFTARKDHVRLPNGNEIPDYYVLEYPTWVNVLAITAEGRMVMVRQYRHGLGVTALEMVAGVMDPGDESAEAAARRELWEETGYAGGEWSHWATFAPNPGAMNNVCHTFLAQGVTRVSGQHLEPTEDIDVCLMDPSEVRAVLETDGVEQALMAASLWKWFAKTEH